MVKTRCTPIGAVNYYQARTAWVELQLEDPGNATSFQSETWATLSDVGLDGDTVA